MASAPQSSAVVVAQDRGTTFRRVESGALVSQLSWGSLVALSLVPGALMSLAFVVLAPGVERLGFPPIAALLAAIVLVLVPIEIGIVVRAGRQSGSLLGAVPYRRSLPLRMWVVLVPVLIVAAFVGFGLHQAIEPQLIASFFGWLPDWYVTPLPLDHVRDYSASAWIVTIAAYFAINGLLGPIVEELYFRGYLLPRMERLGRLAPLVNAALFSIYHFWSPWQIVARILALAPTVYAVRATQNVRLGMVVHCTLNCLGVLLVSALIVGRL